jgi:hypothetical protein
VDVDAHGRVEAVVVGEEVQDELVGLVESTTTKVEFFIGRLESSLAFYARGLGKTAGLSPVKRRRTGTRASGGNRN